MNPTRLRTLLSLEEWREQIDIPPYHFAQVGDGFPREFRHGCSDVTYQYASQMEDGLAREEIGRAIHTAEQLFASAMGFYPAPKFIQGERLAFPGPIQFAYHNTMLDLHGDFKVVTADYKYIQQVGVEVLTLVEAGAAVSYTDSDSDTVLDLFTVTVTVAAGTLPSEIAVYFTASDRANRRQEYFEIRPLDVTVTDTTATITGRRWLMVKPIKQEGFTVASLNVTDAGNFVTTVDVYTRSVDTTQAGSLVWQNRPGMCGDQPCSSAISVGCFGNYNGLMGQVTPQSATWNADEDEWVAHCLRNGIPPTNIVMNYLAGYPRQADGRMDQNLARCITALSVTLLSRRKCGCSRANAQLDLWQNYPGEGEVNNERRRVIATIEKINSLWGAKQGAIEAWELAADYAIWGVAKA